MSTADRFDYLAVPVINILNPAAGSTRGGDTVFVIGTGLDGASRVTFGDGATGEILPGGSDVQQSFRTGAGAAGDTTFTLTTLGGTSNALPFTFIAPPVIGSVNPRDGPEAGGIAVTILGGNLAGAIVRFGVTQATVTFDSDTSLTALAPAGTGVVALTVT